MSKTKVDELIDDLKTARTNYDAATSACEMRKTEEKLKNAENAIREHLVSGAGIVKEQEEKIAALTDENARLRAGFQVIIDRKPVFIDGKEWRMEFQDCVKISRQALEKKS